MTGQPYLREVGCVCAKCGEINRLYSTDEIIAKGFGRVSEACRKCKMPLSLFIDFRP